jgi:hypothetical protein
VGSRAQHAEEKDDQGKKKETAHLTTAFGLPAIC